MPTRSASTSARAARRLDGERTAEEVRVRERLGQLGNACTSGAARGLKLHRLLDRRDTFTQAIEFVGKTRATTVAEPLGPLRLTVVPSAGQSAGQNGACATFTFDPADCKRNATSTKPVCR